MANAIIDNITNSSIRCTSSSKIPPCPDSLPPIITLLHVAADETVTIPTTGDASWRFPRREDAETTSEDPTVPSNLTNILVVNHCEPLKSIIITGNIMGDADIGTITFEVFDIFGVPIPSVFPVIVSPGTPPGTLPTGPERPVAFTTTKIFTTPLPANTPFMTGFQRSGTGGNHSFTIRFLAQEC